MPSSPKNSKNISTSALAKKLGVPTKEMFSRLLEAGYIAGDGGTRVLTEAGKRNGGVLLPSTYGEYIAWPEDIIDIPSTPAKVQENKTAERDYSTATDIAKVFGLSAIKINFVLSELGWVKSHAGGWVLTPQGKQQGGTQHEDSRTDIPYVRWPDNIAESRVLIETVNKLKEHYWW